MKEHVYAKNPKEQEELFFNAVEEALKEPGSEVDIFDGEQRILSLSLTQDPLSKKDFLLVRNISKKQLITRLGGDSFDDLGDGLFGIDIQKFVADQKLKRK